MMTFKGSSVMLVNFVLRTYMHRTTRLRSEEAIPRSQTIGNGSRRSLTREYDDVERSESVPPESRRRSHRRAADTGAVMRGADPQNPRLIVHR